ncbi:MAG: hypothetical protein V4655_14480 [Bdellovibrionota bacterium]|nr:MAG: hypothetical protein EOP10_20260 [Pseudomonadota bacterium]
MVLSWDQIASLIGAFLILIAYAVESIRPGYLSRWTFQSLNAFGSFGLFLAALVNNQYGFIVLEGAWFIISCVSLIRLAIVKK